MRSRLKVIFLGSGLLTMVLATALAQDRPKSAAKRAQPPKFDPAKASEYFFDDVFAKLVGPRPVSTGAAAASSGVAATTAAPSGSTPATAVAGGRGWPKIISAGTIEDEIKAIKQEVDKNVTTPSDFAGRGHKVIRREFSILAMLFAIINEYEGDVRFKKDASKARNLFARTANNTKAGGNSNVFNEAKMRKTDLEELLSGSSISAEGGEDTSEWAMIIDRTPLMQRLEAGFQGRVTPALANKDEFSKNVETVMHEAEMIGTLATVLTKDGMNDATDESYAGFAKSMKQAASEIVEAVKLNSYEQARAAAGKIDKACSQCHESFRG